MQGSCAGMTDAERDLLLFMAQAMQNAYSGAPKISRTIAQLRGNVFREQAKKTMKKEGKQ